MHPIENFYTSQWEAKQNHLRLAKGYGVLALSLLTAGLTMVLTQCHILPHFLLRAGAENVPITLMALFVPSLLSRFLQMQAERWGHLWKGFWTLLASAALLGWSVAPFFCPIYTGSALAQSAVLALVGTGGVLLLAAWVASTHPEPLFSHRTLFAISTGMLLTSAMQLIFWLFGLACFHGLLDFAFVTLGVSLSALYSIVTLQAYLDQRLSPVQMASRLFSTTFFNFLRLFDYFARQQGGDRRRRHG